MRILYFSSDYGPHDHRFLSALGKTAHEVLFLRLEKGPRQIENRPVPSEIRQLHWSGGQQPFRWRDLPRLLFDLRRVIREVKPDLIHAGPIQTCAFLSVLSGFRPILSMSWGFDLMQDAERNAWWRWVTRFTLKRSAFFTADARVTCRRAISYGMRPDRIRMFPWGVDLARFAPQGPKAMSARVRRAAGGAIRAERSRRRAVRESFVMLCNRSWEPRYGVDVLAAAFVEAARRDPRLLLVLLSGGSQAQAIQEILQNGGAMNRTFFGGQVAQMELPRWYRRADLYISPSHVDGSSVSLMEALACGLPVLVSDIPANKEWVRQGVNGWLFPDGDAEALAEGILRIAAERKQLKRVARAGRATAERRADWEKNFAVLLRAYELAVRLN